MNYRHQNCTLCLANFSPENLDQLCGGTCRKEGITVLGKNHPSRKLLPNLEKLLIAHATAITPDTVMYIASSIRNNDCYLTEIRQCLPHLFDETSIDFLGAATTISRVAVAIDISFHSPLHNALVVKYGFDENL